MKTLPLRGVAAIALLAPTYADSINIEFHGGDQGPTKGTFSFELTQASPRLEAEYHTHPFNEGEPLYAWFSIEGVEYDTDLKVFSVPAILFSDIYFYMFTFSFADATPRSGDHSDIVGPIRFARSWTFDGTTLTGNGEWRGVSDDGSTGLLALFCVAGILSAHGALSGKMRKRLRATGARTASSVVPDVDAYSDTTGAALKERIR